MDFSNQFSEEKKIMNIYKSTYSFIEKTKEKSAWIMHNFLKTLLIENWFDLQSSAYKTLIDFVVRSKVWTIDWIFAKTIAKTTLNANWALILMGMRGDTFISLSYLDHILSAEFLSRISRWKLTSIGLVWSPAKLNICFRKCRWGLVRDKVLKTDFSMS